MPHYLPSRTGNLDLIPDIGTPRFVAQLAELGRSVIPWRLRTHTMQMLLLRAREWRGLNGIHDLRHTHASRLIAAGEHPKAIQTRLGHPSIQVTIDRYGHLMDGLDDQTADRLDAIAQSVRGPRVAQATQPTDLRMRRKPR